MEQAGLGTRLSYSLPVTQEQLSEALGLTPVHVNRTLQTLRADGLIRTEQRMVHIDDWDRLTTVAQFDPTFLLLRHSQEDDASPVGAEQSRRVTAGLFSSSWG